MFSPAEHPPLEQHTVEVSPKIINEGKYCVEAKQLQFEVWWHIITDVKTLKGTYRDVEYRYRVTINKELPHTTIPLHNQLLCYMNSKFKLSM